jgi:uncharacterized membrane protein YeiH
VKRRLDFFGVLVLSFAAANSGGIARDLLIGAVPPAAVSDWRYLAVSLLAGAITFYWHPITRPLTLLIDGPIASMVSVTFDGLNIVSA